jgi:hypothetical protein
MRNKDELIASRFLGSLQVGEVKHEPDGNVPPDFQVNGKIGVEVRRLNQNYLLPGGKKEGFEQITASAWLRMENLLKKFGPSVDGECWDVLIQFRRPLSWKTLEADISSRLEEFALANHRDDASFHFGENFAIDLYRSRRDKGLFFYLMGSCPLDAGGAVMALVEQNLRLCVEEKERKVAPYRHKYDEWWLVLINRVDLHMEAEDYANFRASVVPPIPHSFDRIFFVDPRDHLHWFEF